MNIKKDIIKYLKSKILPAIKSLYLLMSINKAYYWPYCLLEDEVLTH